MLKNNAKNKIPQKAAVGKLRVFASIGFVSQRAQRIKMA